MATTYSTWPTAAQVQQVLRGAGLIKGELTAVQEIYDWDGVIEATVSEFEQATRYEPFLADADAIVVPIAIESPTRLLSLPTPFFRITDVTVKQLGRGGAGQTPDALVQGADYDLSPIGAEALGKPIKAITLYPPFTRRTSILLTVTGQRGYSDTLPAAVFQAVLEKAAVRAEAALRGEADEEGDQIDRPVERKKVGDVETWYATSSAERTRLSTQANASWAAAIKAYRNVRIA